jgi:hypothetical protein
MTVAFNEPELMDKKFEPLVQSLQSILQLDLNIFSANENDFTGTVKGEIIGSETAHIKAGPKICTFLVSVGAFKEEWIGPGGPLLLRLLELNFKHTFGRVSMVEIAEKENSPQRYLLCETMFFWSEAVKNSVWFKEKAEQRLRSLIELRFEAVEELKRFEAYLTTGK